MFLVDTIYLKMLPHILEQLNISENGSEIKGEKDDQ